MKTKHRFMLAVLIALGLGMLTPTPSSAAYPDHPIQLVIPYVAGATGDITARMLAEELEKILGAKIVSLNKPGASAVLGTDAVVRSKKDGYTLLYAGASAKPSITSSTNGFGTAGIGLTLTSLSISLFKSTNIV